MTATQAKRPTAATELPDLLTLAKVERNPRRSGSRYDHYLAQSDSEPSRRHDVIHDKDADTWTCSGAWCGKATWCRHRQRARTLALARFWEALLSDCAPAELRAMFPAKQQQLDHDIDALSAWAAIVVIDCLLAAAAEPLVAA